MQSATREGGPPILIQGSAAPIFRSRSPSESHLQCRKCNRLLIEGYFPESFIEVGIKCFHCQEITWTPGLDDGEILPVPIVTLGEQGNYLIGETVDYETGVAMTTDRQIALNNAACSPKKVSELAFEVSEDAVAALAKRFGDVSGHESAARSAELKRYHASGRSGSRELPFDWAIWKITECLREGVINIDDIDTNVALGRIYLFREVDSKWGHHPRFSRIAAEFSNSNAFFHTIGQFILAAYYYENGLQLGFSVDDVHGEVKPDLYLRLGADKKFYFEFKTPLSLVWEKNINSTDKAVRKNVRSILKNSNQINKSRPGGLVLMANHPLPAIHSQLEKEMRSFFKHKGRDKPYLAGAVAMHYGNVTRQPGETFRIEMEFRFANVVNEFCNFPHNPLRERPV